MYLFSSTNKQVGFIRITAIHKPYFLLAFLYRLQNYMIRLQKYCIVLAKIKVSIQPLWQYDSIPSVYWEYRVFKGIRLFVFLSKKTLKLFAP